MSYQLPQDWIYSQFFQKEKRYMYVLFVISIIIICYLIFLILFTILLGLKYLFNVM